MVRTERSSLLVSFLLALAILLLIALLLAQRLGGGPAARGVPDGSETANQVEPEEEVFVELSVPVLPEPPEREDQPETAEASLASALEGSDTEQDPAEISEPTEAEVDPAEPESPKNEQSTEPEDPPEDSPHTTEPDSNTNQQEHADERNPAETTPPTEPGDGDRQQPTLKGRIPQLLYAGSTDELAEKYPRLEMVWVYDRDPGTDSDPPRVLMEMVLDESGRLHWRNNRTEEASPGFEYVSMRHHLDDRVHANPEDLRIRQHRKEIFALAGLSEDKSSRLRWGYYRHRAEVFYLARATSAFLKAQEAGQLDFQPERRDYLQVDWAIDAAGEPYVEGASFHPEAGSVVSLEVEQP